jgi:dipeptidase D
MKIDHPKTQETLKWFSEISKIPRCSKNEDQIVQWLVDWAKTNHFSYKLDKVKNIVIEVPPTPGYEHAPIVVIQGHMDMVCEKTPESKHDFTKDPIELVYEGEWLTANGTTLGADNGIALAMAMAMALDQDTPHPPLELLFTVDEETGLTGANSLEPGFIKGRILINVDSEDEGVFTVGCAGGINTNLYLPVCFEKAPADLVAIGIHAGGMKGGHSGIDIAKEKANAIKTMCRILETLSEITPLRLAAITGGSAHNAIPRDCRATILIDPAKSEAVLSRVAQLEAMFHTEYKNVEPDLSLTVQKLDKPERALGTAETERVIQFVRVIPHGVAAMSTDIANLVETSNNLARISIEEDEIRILTSQRSSVMSRLHALTHRIEDVAKLAGGRAQSGDGYPPWQPNMDSPLLARSLALYKRLFNKEPKVEVIHAGLECGIIADRNPGMDMISIGPDLRYPHSPDEKVHVGAIGKVWDFMAALMKDLK